MSFLGGILILVLLVLSSLFLIKYSNKALNQNIWMELCWILFPVCILVSIGLPSLNLLYQIDETFPTINNWVKVVGYQWYWTYETAEMKNSLNCEVEKKLQSTVKESFMEKQFDGNDGTDQLNNLSANNELICAAGESQRFVITASDVMHSWALPSLFVKVDAIPGRLNQMELIFPHKSSTVYGQCSELCGVNHSFMPIVLSLVF
uniref:Cytochrome c oxidase subunit 2 n=1 Tax=Isodiametra pulchra TaxID=504439 RepID=A0A1X9WDA2_ISOPU|nr:cytochrome c oxidase subunit II [Isodiametra pulchra]ARS00907.1 cytochrome c oxidase subunit 2 [Isodiametra pulchra]